MSNLQLCDADLNKPFKFLNSLNEIYGDTYQAVSVETDSEGFIIDVRINNMDRPNDSDDSGNMYASIIYV